MKRVLLLTLLSVSLCACQPGPPSNPSSSPSPVAGSSESPPRVVVSGSPTPELIGDLQADLQTDKPTYAPGEKIQVTVIAMGLTDSAWVWMVPDDMEVKPTARPVDSPYPSPTVGTKSPVELSVDKPGKYQLYLFPNAELSAPIANRAVEIQ